MIVDYGQTLDIKNQRACWSEDNGSRFMPYSVPAGCTSSFYETNPLLGRDPSDSRIRNYFVGASLAHVAITYLLPKQYRPSWQWGTLAIQLGVISKNYQLGLSVDF